MQLRRGLAGGLAALLATVALTSCSDGGESNTGGETGSDESRIGLEGGYVALGDSYTAAPGVPQTETQSGCFRSDRNYPNLIADAVDATSFDDVSCAGASTVSLVGAQQSGNAVVPAQFDALTEDTALVTISIGGNDVDLFQTLIASCVDLGPTDSDGSPCRDRFAADPVQATIDQIAERVTSAVTGVHDRAPEAEVFLIGYPQPVPADGTCPELPLAAADYPFVRDTVIALGAALEQAAAAADATYVDLLAPSEGHDICAGDEAWIQGTTNDPGAAIALHPFAAEQRAVADLVLAELG